ncbi:heterocyst differentiation protein HetZ [Nostoc sp. FACHB-87]|uniref:heterocyst differentiation protein HetZ n=1 Tax=Nostocales TaxID=1161 RepID=UPI001684E819|nr:MULTISPECIES: heterocyst differentiation protein HetZ [Nostocales]MBD2300721.1 heterocyst differentiation protein HetZ [Nostoc sp. FACHB-190]MBD2459132.1 heterocyst differentiation protein HetZ [Nostoc sp. FACHB-87]MBD2478671.1 heterocyst differentiation protein HetZ [Anabaena sp. FACHB-83]MBD2489133.1 heterocyst differentiation protein HetZ [Aulosira sp. FACHB-615]
MNSAATATIPTATFLGEHTIGVEVIFQLLYKEFRQSTKASEQNCHDVATRITTEVYRICSESKRIQASGAVESSAMTLARHRLQQCLRYYQLGSNRGRVELHSTLSAIIYRYINPPQKQLSYQGRLTIIEDFLQSFYLEALNAFRRENQLGTTYRPQTLLELAEYMAFTERYGKRRIPLPGRQQQLIILRAQTFSQQQPPETSVDIEQAAEGSSGDGDGSWEEPAVQQLRSTMATQAEPEPEEDTLRSVVITELMSYLEQKQQSDCADYFSLRLKDLSTQEIEAILNLTPRQRDYLQQRFKYHLIRFALLHRWELVHEWLEASLHTNLGLTPQQWEAYTSQLDEKQRSLLDLKQQGQPDDKIAKTLGLSMAQLQKRWFKVLEQAWEIRNSLVSGSGASTHE